MLSFLFQEKDCLPFFNINFCFGRDKYHGRLFLNIEKRSTFAKHNNIQQHNTNEYNNYYQF
jgi:hypothetical protein